MAPRLTADIGKRFAEGFELEAVFETDPDAQVTVLFGPSGSGKTTLLRCLAGLELPDRGKISFADATWFDSQRGIALQPQRRNIGYLFQDHALFPHLSVRRNIQYGLSRLSRINREARVAELANFVGVGALLQRSPEKLSGGERQRVALARALAPRPQLLLLDEPLSALDVPTRESLRVELRRLLKQIGMPVILVTHDRDEALALGDSMVLIAGGKVEQIGRVHEVFSRPANVVAAGIVGVETVAHASVREIAGGLATVRIGSVDLSAVITNGELGDVYVCIRAEDVTLERGAVPESSARNRICGRVTDVGPSGSLVRVTIDCGFELTALVTKRSSEQLGLRPGVEVTAVVKAQAVHTIPRT